MTQISPKYEEIWGNLSLYYKSNSLQNLVCHLVLHLWNGCINWSIGVVMYACLINHLSLSKHVGLYDWGYMWIQEWTQKIMCLKYTGLWPLNGHDPVRTPMINLYCEVILQHNVFILVSMELFTWPYKGKPTLFMAPLTWAQCLLSW